MRFNTSLYPCSMLLALTLATAGVAHSQEIGWTSSVSVSPVFQGDSDLDGGGRYSSKSALVRAGVSADLGQGSRAGVTLSYDYTDYSFSNPVRFGGTAPWGTVQRYGVAIPLVLGLKDGWGVGVTPSFDWFQENGADAGDSFAWGGIVSASKRFQDGNRLGVGMGVFNRIDKTSVFPYVLIDWRLSDKWRLVNPLPAGPTGAAGLELEYRFDSGWNVGVGAAWRSSRFRLSNDGPVANGIGEERSVPVFLRATHAFDGRMSLSLYAGVVTAGQLRVENSSGDKVSQVDFDIAPLFGATFSARF